MTLHRPVSYFGRTNGRAPHRVFGILTKDRLAHVYVIGRTGVGKSNLLECLALQDIIGGRGLCVIDPHGDLVERLRDRIPPVRMNQCVYLNAADPLQPYSYNPLRKVAPRYTPLAVSGVLEAFRKLWSTDWGVRMEHILRNCLFALIESGDAALPDILRMLTDQGFRRRVVSTLSNEQVRMFWEQEFPKYNPRYRQEAISPIQNKVGAFLADPRLRRIVDGSGEDLRIRRIMDDEMILLVNLNKGLFGEDSAGLLGAILMTAVTLAGLSRSDIAPVYRTPFFVLVDEFQTFTTLSVANMVSELRKYGVGLTLAHQHLYQLEPEVRHAILGNVGTLVSFRIGPEDARVIAREFEPVFSPTDLSNLPNHSVYVKLLIDGAPARPFSADTIRPEELGL